MLLNARQVHDAERKTQRILLGHGGITSADEGATLLQLQRDTLEMLVRGHAAAAGARSSGPRDGEAVPAQGYGCGTHARSNGDSFPVLPSRPACRTATAARPREWMSNQGAGPCCVAVLTRKLLIVTDVDADPQWRAFAEFAAAAGNPRGMVHADRFISRRDCRYVRELLRAAA